MGGNAGVGETLHFLGADLHLDGHAVGTEQAGVQGLVAVGLGNGQVILEAPGDRLVEVVHDPEHAVAVVHRVGQDAHAEDIGQLVEAEPLLLHLAVDTVDVLGAVLDLGLDIDLLEPVADGRLDGLEDLLAVADDFATGLLQRAIAHRPGMTHRQVQQLVAHRIDAETVGDGRVDVHGLARDAAPLLGADRAEGAHVVQPVGELDQDDADILDHRQHHLAEVFRLLLGAGVETEVS